ncbi:DMT family transporter [Actinomadura algeriensis]|uniref:Drug/metabolite transporter (DMT)-like permease n=1 Tax=Actinomadura algeriensis TaxID=1679523 RepID=A0ABR9JSU5_9ACTN|nr:DMT family transporter [Actinomadura algeriensis]MBE1533646.1 drug/metabolite transporter (DMT)-like permease [Actinomadura algeriensis]
MPVAILAAVLAGACFALAGVLQQRAASARPSREAMSVRLLGRLARDRTWLCGIGFAVGAYGFQMLALAFGPLALVQPLIVTELVFAIPLSVHLNRLRMGAREWFGAFAVAGGLALALVAADPRGGDKPVPLGEWLLTLAAVGAALVLALAASRFAGEMPRASLIALAAGLVMGTQSVLLAATVSKLEKGIVPLFTTWHTYALVIASVGGLVLIQSAFQAGPLAATMPVIDSAEPVIAVTLGILLFDEQIRVGPVWTSLSVLGIAILLTGIAVLDTSPLLQALHRQEIARRPA